MFAVSSKFSLFFPGNVSFKGDVMGREVGGGFMFGNACKN